MAINLKSFWENFCKKVMLGESSLVSWLRSTDLPVVHHASGGQLVSTLFSLLANHDFLLILFRLHVGNSGDYSWLGDNIRFQPRTSCGLQENAAWLEAVGWYSDWSNAWCTTGRKSIGWWGGGRHRTTPIKRPWLICVWAIALFCG